MCVCTLYWPLPFGFGTTPGRHERWAQSQQLEFLSPRKPNLLVYFIYISAICGLYPPTQPFPHTQQYFKKAHWNLGVSKEQQSTNRLKHDVCLRFCFDFLLFLHSKVFLKMIPKMLLCHIHSKLRKYKISPHLKWMSEQIIFDQIDFFSIHYIATITGSPFGWL